jgi:hypothetical protein
VASLRASRVERGLAFGTGTLAVIFERLFFQVMSPRRSPLGGWLRLLITSDYPPTASTPR